MIRLQEEQRAILMCIKHIDIEIELFSSKGESGKHVCSSSVCRLPAMHAAVLREVWAAHGSLMQLLYSGRAMLVIVGRAQHAGRALWTLTAVCLGECLVTPQTCVVPAHMEGTVLPMCLWPSFSGSLGDVLNSAVPTS